MDAVYQRQRSVTLDLIHRERCEEVWEFIATARHFPFQIIAKYVCLTPRQMQIGLIFKMQRCGLFHLSRGREVDESIRQINRGT